MVCRFLDRRRYLTDHNFLFSVERSHTRLAKPKTKMPNNKASHPVTFRIKRSPKTKQFRCVVDHGNGEPTYVGEPCKNRKDVRDTIESHIDAILGGRWNVADESPAAKKPKLDNSKLNRNWP